jgi:hypothetical protein
VGHNFDPAVSQAMLHEANLSTSRYLCFCFNVARCQTDATNTEQEMS